MLQPDRSFGSRIHMVGVELTLSDRMALLIQPMVEDLQARVLRKVAAEASGMSSIQDFKIDRHVLALDVPEIFGELPPDGDSKFGPLYRTYGR